MKNLTLLLSSALLIACGGRETQTHTDFSNITFSMDTVVVDPGEEIINLRGGLWNSTMNSDNSKLYLWDNQAFTLDIINLDELVLEKKVPFEKEGPNGTGPFVRWISRLDNERILMANFSEMGLFDLQSNKLRTYNLSKESFEGAELSEGINFYQKSLATNDGNIIWGLLENEMREEESFSKVDFQQKQIKKIELPGKELLQDYPLKLRTENMNGVMPSAKNVSRAGNKLILSNSAYTNLFIVDILSDSAYHVDYTPNLTAKGKKGGYPLELDSEQRFREVAEQLHSEINFISPIWDAQKKLFYRFSFETSPTGIFDGPLFKMPEGRPISKVFLSILDEEFKLIGESLTELTFAPTYSFVKDGMIWIYVNIDDELGFVRMAINN